MNYKLAQAIYRRTLPLSGYEVAALNALSGAARDESTLPSPSIKRLAERSGFSTGSMKKALDTLSSKGVLTISKRVTASGQKCNVYEVHIDALGCQDAVEESVAEDTPKSSPREPSKSSPREPLTPKSSPREPSKSSQEFTRVHESSPGDHYNKLDIKLDTKLDNKQTNIQQRNIKSTNTVNCKGTALADVIVTLKEIWGDAKETLARKGISPADADKALKAALPAFTDKANSLKAKGFPGITNKRAYLAHMLAGMALEPTPQKPQADEPRDLGSLFAKVAEEFKAEYPDQADKITGSKLIELVPPTTYDGLRALEAGHWAGIVSPLVIVKQRVQPYVFRLVEDARGLSKEQARKDYAKLQMKLYEYLDALRIAHKSGEPESKIKALEEHVTELQAKLDSLAAAREVA